MNEGLNEIHKKVTAYRRKYYLNLFVRGSLLTATLVLGYFVLASLVEYNLWLGKGARLLIFLTFFLFAAFCVFVFLKVPLAWWVYKRGLGEEQSARLIGNHFPEISDRLLNVIQLEATASGSLAQAGILQKARSFKNISFESAIDLKDNLRYLKYFGVTLAIIASLILVDRTIFTQSAKRIVQFNKEFSPQAPFAFNIDPQKLSAFFNEDFLLPLNLAGSSIPENAYLLIGSQRWKMVSLGNGNFSYLFEKFQNETVFQIEAAGFYSPTYKIVLVNRPELTKINVQLLFPAYLGKKQELLSNAGNLEIPEGTTVTWKIGAANTNTASISFTSAPGENKMGLMDDQLFQFSKNLKNPDQYSISLENEKSKNKEAIVYSIAVIKDQHPQIVVDNLKDSILYKNILLGGSLSDDYGLTALKVNYQISRGQEEEPTKSILVPLASARNQQSFFYKWNLDSIKLKPGDKLSYHLQVWDNDGVNGRKSTRSANYLFALPEQEELKAEISKSQQAAESKIDQSLKKAKDLKESIDKAQEKLKGKQNLDWQDKKMLEELIQQKEKLDNAIKNLQKENKLLEQKKETFSEESERIKEKSEQIQKIMNELLDEETKKLFQELEKLLKENADPSQMQKLLDKMDRKEINMEKELERTLELFKQLQYDYKLEQAIDELKQQNERQENLLEKTQEAAGEKPEKQEGKNQDKTGDKQREDSDGQKEKPSTEELAQEQEGLQKKNEEFKKTLDELEKMGEELDAPQDTPSDQQMQELDDAQEQSKEELKQGKPKKSAEQQKKAVKQMQQMQQKLEGMQSSMEMEMDMANLETLRQILHGLIKLSYDQETLMKDFNQVQQTDPRYVTLSQQQLKVKDDAKVLEDSLLSLSKKDPFLGSIVTKEVGELNDHLDKAALNVKERKKGNASSEMQFSMTSINNLALMLNDHFNMMMDMMKNAKPGGKGKKKGNQKQPNLGKLQQQLNQQMQELKNGNKSGRQLSEEFAKMAAEQERIRRALQEMQEKLKQDGGKIPGGDLPGKMEQTEMDLVNKQITEQTIRRQNEIITRLLEAEKSMREQNQDQERKGETAKDYTQEMPKAFEEYLRLKEKEVELLKTIPPRLFPYYKKEVNEYFKRIGTKD